MERTNSTGTFAQFGEKNKKGLFHISLPPLYLLIICLLILGLIIALIVLWLQFEETRRSDLSQFLKIGCQEDNGIKTCNFIDPNCKEDDIKKCALMADPHGPFVGLIDERVNTKFADINTIMKEKVADASTAIDNVLMSKVTELESQAGDKIQTMIQTKFDEVLPQYGIQHENNQFSFTPNSIAKQFMDSSINQSINGWMSDFGISHNGDHYAIEPNANTKKLVSQLMPQFGFQYVNDEFSFMPNSPAKQFLETSVQTTVETSVRNDMIRLGEAIVNTFRP